MYFKYKFAKKFKLLFNFKLQKEFFEMYMYSS